MPEEERQRLKKHYIKEFQTRKQIRQELELSQKRRNVDRALNNIVSIHNSIGGGVPYLDQKTAEDEQHGATKDLPAVSHSELLHHDPDEEPRETENPTVVPPPAKTIGPKLRSDTSREGI